MVVGLIDRWLRKPKPVRVRPSTLPASDPLREESRREMLRIAVSDTLRKHGIPLRWVAVDTLPAVTRLRQRGLHLRLVLREWQPTLLPYGPALQKAVQSRLLRIDPLSSGWLVGMSWAFDMVDHQLCPALPASASWARPHEGPRPQEPAASRPEPREDLLAGDRDPAFARRHEHTDFRPTQPMLRQEA
jgi:hypothetical protein